MRPVRLDLSGFAAFRDPTVVDFTDADYFALTGPTGSGKSTVIDGLTFALYGSAPRWGRENAIQYALAPTANRCTVRLVFDVAGDRYVVAREVRRVGKQIAQRNARLERYADPAATGDPSVDEPTESLAADPKTVRSQVAELLGLDFEDFCTCVVLPQGDFATFLRASVGQRQDILLKLLGARHYDAIGRLAGRRANDARARVDALSGELAGHADATAAAEDAARAREGELSALVVAITTEVTAVGALADERERAAAATAGTTDELTRLDAVTVPEDVEDLQRAGEAAEQAYREASVAEQQASAAAVVAEEALRAGPSPASVEETLRWHSELAGATGRAPAARTTAAAAAAGLAEATQSASTAHDALETARTRHDADRAEVRQAAAGVTELTGRLDLLRSVTMPAGAADLDTAVIAARDRWQAARRALDAAETTLAAARATRAGLPDRTTLAHRLQTLSAYETTHQQLAALRRDATDVAGRSTVAEQTLTEAQATRRRAGEALEGARSHSAAAEVRAHLEVGHACPVCTQVVTRLPDPLGLPAVDSARTALTEAERAVAEAEAAALAEQRRGTTLEAQIAAAVERLADLDRALPSDLTPGVDLAEGGDPNGGAGWLGQPAGDERDPERDRKVLTELARRLEDALAQEHGAATAQDAAQVDLQRADDDGQRLAATARQGWAEVHATNGRLTALGAPAVTSETLGQAWAELLTWTGATATALSTGDLPAAQAATTAAEAARRASADQLEAAVATDRSAREALTAATLADDRARTDLTALTTLVARLQEVLVDRPSAEEAARLADEHRRLADRAAESRARAQQAAADRQHAETVRDQRRTEQQTARATLVRVREELAGLGVPPLDTDDLPLAWTALATWTAEQTDRRRAALTDLTADLERAGVELEKRLSRIRDLLDQHHVDRPADPVPTDPTDGGAATRWARIPTLVELQLERARAATTSIVQRRAAAERLQSMITADTQTEQVSRTLQQLMSAKRFPQWLADAALDTLVADASASLLQLSGGQFELTHDRGEFFVIDHADADSRRSVKTLSGGETFQASLALALALSDQLATLAAGGRTTLDSIFLDEGFGTLDPDALEIVAGTLENLAQGNRMVGVVTHVAALADRVPVRFEVSRDSRTSTIERVGP